MVSTYLRSLILALLFLTGTGGLLTSALAGESDPVVASVSGEPIRLSYVYQHIEALPLGDQIDVRDQLNDLPNRLLRKRCCFSTRYRRISS